ncbi:MAG: ferritin family protein [Chloroflexi bacterium]|nr:ferritin family protein [Chloroflexota bacterium]
MPPTIILQDILTRAIAREAASQRFYGNLAQKVTAPPARDILTMLVKQERGHQLLLERYQRGELSSGALGRETVMDYRIAEHLYLPEMTPDMELPDIFLLAANREQASHDFYLSLARAHPPGEIRTILRGLAREELGHKSRMEFLFGEVAFPQTSGG